ncbi:MAG: aldehyde dehydrogenase family protein, partial [Clostridia bacterium]|nr:aldehyde dehydrogenase family protein [Clostridia bacterium]
MNIDKDLRSVQEVRDLLTEAHKAQEVLAHMGQGQLDKITLAISKAASAQARRLADMAVEETGFGIKADKEIKNRFAAETLYDAIKDEKTRGILAEDKEHRTIDIGVPAGVVAGLVPSTNPTSTVIYKSMICMKAGNPIVFSPHPSAVNCILETVNVVRRAAEEAGAPAGAIGCITTPTLEATQELMKDGRTRLILATGGGAMVKAAYSSGTPAIGVGAG